ncbi:MAG: alpha/beta fold hydrolase [Myxococcales bacterium]|nr:alpha/beta fold hydrolase [Myxococcales bacterium]
MPKFSRTRFSNGDGWQLQATRCADQGALVPGRRPLLIVPGYGMNSFIFGYHPRGPSMMGALAAAGFEVWTVDFRAQGGSRSVGGSRSYRLEDVACVDLPATLDHILARTETGADAVSVLGASLGGTYVAIYLALNRDAVARAKIGAVVAIGAPLRWERAHPVMRVMSLSPWLIGKVPTRGMRGLAAIGLPLIARRFPRALSIYLHADHVDISKHRELVRTVDETSPAMNRQLAAWLRDRDLRLRGVNVTLAMAEVTAPLLVVLANGDGIVPEATAMSTHAHWGGDVRDVLRVGDDELRFAHADLFISNHAQARVFTPIGAWLAAH